MTKGRCAAYRILVVGIALYGWASACVCADHGPSLRGMSACHQCPGHDMDAAGVRVSSHHQCCGMQRAPIAVKKNTSPVPANSDGILLPHVAILLREAGVVAIALSPFCHGPPHCSPVYLTTHRFLI